MTTLCHNKSWVSRRLVSFFSFLLFLRLFWVLRFYGTGSTCAGSSLTIEVVYGIEVQHFSDSENPIPERNYDISRRRSLAGEPKK